MQICVIGAGVVGLMSAWQLQAEGHQVTVVDRAREPGEGASQRNGAQLSYSYVAPLADASIPAKIPGLLLAADSPLKFRLRASPAQWAWLLAFLRACNTVDSSRTTEALLALAFLSRDIVEPLIAAEGIACGFSRAGKLVLYPDVAALEAARSQVAYQAKLGCEQQVLSAAECVAREPVLAGYAGGIAGGVWTASDAAADCHDFCTQLAARLQARGVCFELGRSALGFERKGSRITRLFTDGEPIDAAAYVLATGAAAPRLAVAAGLKLNIQPLKGYSVTLRPRGEAVPKVSITDLRRKVVFAPLTDASGNTRVRVAGFVEIGAGAGIPPARIEALLDSARQVIGLTEVEPEIDAWAGFRPATASGRPVIGATPLANLYLNVGHGTLGWTLAAGSARLVADAVAKRTPSLAAEAFAYRA